MAPATWDEASTPARKAAVHASTDLRVGRGPRPARGLLGLGNRLTGELNRLRRDLEPGIDRAELGPGPTATPGPTQAIEPSAVPSPVIYYEVEKNAEGGHGGPPLVSLPATIAIDYTVRGTCTFSIDLDTAATTTGPQLRLAVTGPEMSGTWRLSIPAGSYYVLTGEAVGCTYHVTVGPG